MLGNYFQYASKSRAFGHAGMIVRAALTCIDNNKNLQRAQVVIIVASIKVLGSVSRWSVRNT